MARPASARAAPTTQAIVAHDLRKSFGKVEALRGLSLQVPKGSILVILGPNGAGKTTLVRILATLLRPDSGTAAVAGHDVVRQPSALRRVIGLAGQYAAVDEHLTGRENLRMVARLYHLPRREAKARTDELLAKVDLLEAADRVTKGYSGGMRRRLDLAAAMVGDPEVLFLDEPTTGLDPPSRLALWAMIGALRGQGKTIVLTTQYLEEAERLADRIAVVDHGTIIAEGTVAQLKSRVGGDVVDVKLGSPAQTAAVAAALKRFRPKADASRGLLHVPAPHGMASLAAVMEALPEDALDAEVALRRPTLDDVFLTLTGHAPDADGDGAVDQDEGKGPRARKGKKRAGRPGSGTRRTGRGRKGANGGGA